MCRRLPSVYNIIVSTVQEYRSLIQKMTRNSYIDQTPTLHFFKKEDRVPELRGSLNEWRRLPHLHFFTNNGYLLQIQLLVIKIKLHW